MKLTFINGSPRGKSSNTKILLDHFLKGFRSVESTFEFEEIFLKTEKDKLEPLKTLKDSDIVILAFPLYTDSMPGIVKEFIETIDPQTFHNRRLKLGFIVQSGFPEGHHSVYLQRYLEKLTRRMGVKYLGTAIRGGVEGIKIQPRWMTRYLDLFYELGKHLALEWEFNEEILHKLRKPEHLKGFRLQMYKMLRVTGLSNFFWNSQLKENHAFENRFATPYTEHLKH